MEGEEEVESCKPESMMTSSHMAIRCAKAAILVASLKAASSSSSPNRFHQDQEEEEEAMAMAMAREIRLLRAELAREKLRSSKMKLCGLTEIVLQVLVVLSASTLLLVLAPGSGTS